MTNLEKFERAAENDVKLAFVREFIPLAIIIAVAVTLQQLTHKFFSGNA